jgi:hypothetical protein
MTNGQDKELLDRIMLSVHAKDAGWFDRLFAYMVRGRLAQNERFTLELVAEVFVETGKIGHAKPSPRDQLDVKEIFEALCPHWDGLKSLSFPEQFAEIFRLIYRP